MRLNPQDALEIAKDASLEQLKLAVSLSPGHKILMMACREKETEETVEPAKKDGGGIEDDDEREDDSDMDGEEHRRLPRRKTEIELKIR